MRNVYVLIVALAFTLTAGAQENEQQKFSPEKFDAELQECITRDAKLTPQEAAKFFPLHKEMQVKQRALFERQRNVAPPQDEASCLKAIRERDAIDLEMKRIQQTYHERFLEILPASKVLEIIKAEDRFHRHALKRFSRNKGQQQKPSKKSQPQK